MGSPAIFAHYLTATKPKLHSYMPREHQAKIQQYMNWFLSVLRPATIRLTKVMIGPKLFGHEYYSGEEVEAAKLAFLEVLKRLEGLMDKGQYLISSVEPTVVDIIYYNEVSTALLLTRIGNDRQFNKNYPQLTGWVTRMSGINELVNYEDSLGEIIDGHDLQ